MAIPARMQERILVVSHLKQTAYATILTDVNLQAGKRLPPTAAFFGDPELTFFTDRERTMKGHDYTIVRDVLEQEVAGQLAMHGGSFMAAWMAAFGMGKVTSVQPNAGGNPTAWRHTIKPLDPAVDGKDLPVTTVYAEVANVAGLKRRLHSCAVRTFGLEFPATGPVNLTADLVGSGQITTGALATPPTLLDDPRLHCQNVVFSYGAQGAPPDVTSELVRGSLRFNFTWNLDDENARHPGSGKFRSRAWIMKPDATLEFQRLVDDAVATPQSDFEAGTIVEVKAKVTGAQIGSGPEVHDLEIRGLAVAPRAIPKGQAGDKTLYQYSIAPDDWLKQGSADVLTVIVTNTQSSYLV